MYSKSLIIGTPKSRKISYLMKNSKSYIFRIWKIVVLQGFIFEKMKVVKILGIFS